ncbi:MAG: hypothetical protein ACOCW1_00105 [Chitinispirillaceae bacterium]
MKISKLLGIVSTIAFIGCAPKTTYINLSDLPDTYQCNYMKEICKEAEDFQRQYSKMSEEEKKESKTILNTYIDQCANAQDLCTKSGEQKK